jgi:hypothetical protein
MKGIRFGVYPFGDYFTNINNDRLAFLFDYENKGAPFWARLVNLY